MGTPATRRQYSREGLRHETDLTAKEWRLIAPCLPPPSCFTSVVSPERRDFRDGL